MTGQAINHTLVVYNDPSSVQLIGHTPSTADVAVSILGYLFTSSRKEDKGRVVHS